MASFQVNVGLRLNATQMNTMLSQIAANAGKAQINLRGLQNQTALTERGMIRGAGSFFLMHRAMQMGVGLMKRGAQGAIEFDYALSRLQWAIHANAEQMKVFEKIAQETAIQLGPLGATDVIRGMERFGRATEITQRKLAILAPDVARIVSNIVELSE